MDAHVVTNAQFDAFVQATGYRTLAERPLDSALYPGAQPALLIHGSAVFFMPTGRVDLGDVHNRWAISDSRAHSKDTSRNRWCM